VKLPGGESQDQARLSASIQALEEVSGCDVRLAEALDGSEDVGGGFRPVERLWPGVVGFDVGGDGGFGLCCGAMRASPDRVSVSRAKKRST
jgi:hypothetical protein